MSLEEKEEDDTFVELVFFYFVWFENEWKNMLDNSPNIIKDELSVMEK